MAMLGDTMGFFLNHLKMIKQSKCHAKKFVTFWGLFCGITLD